MQKTTIRLISAFLLLGFVSSPIIPVLASENEPNPAAESINQEEIVPLIQENPQTDLNLEDEDEQDDEEPDSLRSHDSDVLKDFTGVIRQAKPYYCGPAALATVFEQMGIEADQEKIADIAGMDEEKGTTLYGLSQATKKLGYIPVMKKWDIDQLKEYMSDSDAPVVIHDIKSNEGHFTVLREITDEDTVELSDTEAGNIAVDLKTFLHAWTGYVLIVTDEIANPLLSDEKTDVSEKEAKTIWGTYVLVAIGDEFSDSELRELHYCLLKAEKKSSSKKRKEAKKECYRKQGASSLDSDEIQVLEKYGFNNLKNKKDNGLPLLVTSDQAEQILKSIMDQYQRIRDIINDIRDLEESQKSKKRVLSKIDNKLEDMQDQLIRLDREYKATKSKLKNASKKKQKELKNDLNKLEAQKDRLERQIANEKRRIQNEINRLNLEIKKIEASMAKKQRLISSREYAIRNDVGRFKSLYDVQETNVVIYNDEAEKYTGIAGKISNVARIMEVASIVSPVSVFDLCSAYTGKDCISDEKLSGFDKVLVSGSLIPYGGKVFKAAKVTKNGKKVLEVVEVAGKVLRGVGGKGWRGDNLWKDMVKRVEKGGTIEELDSMVPTKDEAVDLIKEARGEVLRIEKHPEGYNSTHTYLHINYILDNKIKGTIKIRE